MYRNHFRCCLGIDLEKANTNSKDNKSSDKSIAIEFNGFIQMVEAGQTYDLTFKTPTSDFKNFLGLVPAAYSGDINKVKNSRTIFSRWKSKRKFN